MNENQKPGLDFMTVGPSSWDTNILTGVDNLQDIHEVHQLPGKILEQPGGTAVNFAYGLLNFVDRVGVCGVTGNDHYGGMIVQELQSQNINTTFIRKDLPKTPRSISSITNNGEKHIYYDGGALDQYTYPEDEFREAVVKTPWMYFSIARFSQYLLPIAREYNIQTVADIQAPEAITEKHETHLLNSNIVFASSAKLKLSVPDFIKKLWKYGPNIVVVTHGEKGATLATNSEQKIAYYPGIKADPVIDTTGAGDNFASAFCGCLSQGVPLEESMLKALVFASNKVQHQGSLSPRMSKQEIQELYKELRQQPIKNS